MKPLIHLCKKDFAFAKSWLIGAWGALALIAVLPAVLDADLATPMLILNMIVPLLLVFAAALKIMRADSWIGSAGFMDTRPLTRWFLLAARLASLFVLVLIPALMASLLGAIAMRVVLSPPDFGLLVMENSLNYGLAISVALLVGAFTRGIGLATILTISLGVLLVWLCVSIHGRPGAFRFLAEGHSLKTSQWLLTEALVLISAIGITWFWMAVRRPAWSWVATALALGLSVSTGFLWQGNLARVFAKRDVPGTNRANIEWLEPPSLAGGRQNGVSFTSVIRPARVNGIADGWLGYPLGFHSKARFTDGTTISSEKTGSRTYGDFTLPLLASLGVNIPDNHPCRSWSRESSTWFECETSRINNHSDRRASINGEATVELYQPVVVANLPPTSGASAVHGRFRYRIERIDSREGQISLSLSVRTVTLASYGDFARSMNDTEIALIDPATGNRRTHGSRRLGWKFSSKTGHARHDPEYSRR